jgi:hypothetical protein
MYSSSVPFVRHVNTGPSWLAQLYTAHVEGLSTFHTIFLRSHLNWNTRAIQPKSSWFFIHYTHSPPSSHTLGIPAADSELFGVSRCPTRPPKCWSASTTKEVPWLLKDHEVDLAQDISNLTIDRVLAHTHKGMVAFLYIMVRISILPYIHDDMNFYSTIYTMVWIFFLNCNHLNSIALIIYIQAY